MIGISNKNSVKTDAELEKISQDMWRVLLESKLTAKDALVVLSRTLTEFYSQAVEKGWSMSTALDVYDEHSKIIRRYILSRGNRV